MSFLILLFVFLFYIYLPPGTNSSLSFNYEGMHMLGSGRRRNHIPSFSDFIMKRDAFPEPLPGKKRETVPVPTPYRSLYQGRRRPNDRRVFRERFNLVGQPQGQQISFEGTFDCPLTYLAVETQCNIPILLRGGVGHAHFNVIIKARPYDEVSGQLRAFCVDTNQNYYKDKKTQSVARLYVFPETSKLPQELD